MTQTGNNYEGIRTENEEKVDKNLHYAFIGGGKKNGNESVLNG